MDNQSKNTNNANFDKLLASVVQRKSNYIVPRGLSPTSLIQVRGLIPVKKNEQQKCEQRKSEQQKSIQSLNPGTLSKNNNDTLRPQNQRIFLPKKSALSINNSF